MNLHQTGGRPPCLENRVNFNRDARRFPFPQAHATADDDGYLGKLCA